MLAGFENIFEVLVFLDTGQYHLRFLHLLQPVEVENSQLFVIQEPIAQIFLFELSFRRTEIL